MALLAVALACGLSACGIGGQAASAPVPTPTVDRFDERRSFALLREQVERYGPRPAGSPASRRLATRLRRLLPGGRFEAVPGGLRNVVGILPGRAPAVVVGAHYDTEALPRDFVGANDGAAGTAAVVELGRALARRPPGGPEVRFVLFDGEEEPAGGDIFTQGTRGSRAYVARHREEVGAMVLLDYVANRGLKLPREATSTPALWEELRVAAIAAGAAEQFPTGEGPAITDDHTPFLRAGIPAIDLIDWTYPGHSLEDGVDKLSVASVEAVGETVRRFIDGWRP